MAIKIMGLHHHAVRIETAGDELGPVRDFYSDVLGLHPDEGRPYIPGVPGWWINVGGDAQIHLIGGANPSPAAKEPGKDPGGPHVALAVEDISEAKAELDRLGVDYWSLVGVAGPDTEQLFVKDPAGNMIELHQYNKCRCVESNRTA